MKEYKAYIFDMDLTLLDTIQTAIMSYSNCFEACGLRFDPSTVTHHLSIPLTDSYDEIKHLTNKDYNVFLQAFLDTANSTMVDYSSIYPDALYIIEKLHKSGKKLGIVTNRNYSAVKAVLTKANLLELFDSIITCDKVTKLKPDAEPIITCINELSVSNKEALYIGDAKNDFQSATNAHLDFVAIERYDNCNFNCDVVVHSLKEIY